MIETVTKDHVIRVALAGACRLPKIGDKISDYSQIDLIWAEQIFTEEEKKFFKVPLWTLSGYGDGYGSGRYGSGYGDGSGDSGYGDGYGYGSWDGSGDSGYGDGYGSGRYGSGYWDGYGDSRYGDGYGSGLLLFENAIKS